MASMQALNTMNRTDVNLRRSMQKLSSGLRADVAEIDNPAGLAISETMRSRIDGMYKAIYNSQDGISLIQTASGALNETQSILQRMRELSVQASNDTLTQQDRSYIQTEIDELKDEIDRIGNTTQFNKKKILNGDQAVLWSSSNKNVKAIIKGGLRQVDQFGQKNSVDGNFVITAKTDPGKAQVQKSDIFKIKHSNVLTNEVVDQHAGVNIVAVKDVPSGSYRVNVSGEAPSSENSAVTGSFGIEKAFSQSSLVGQASRNSSNDDMYTAVTESELNDAASRVVQITDGTNVLAEYEVKVGDTTRSIQDNLMNQLNGTKAQSLAGQSGYKLEAYWNTDENGVDAGDADGIFRAVAYRTDTGETKALQVVGGDFAVEKAGLDQGQDGTEVTILTDVVGEEGTGSMQINVTPDNLDGNASILFEVTSVDTVAGTVTLKATANILTTDGHNEVATADEIVVGVGDEGAANTSIVGFTSAEDDAFSMGALSLQLNSADMAKLYSKGDKFVYNVVVDASTATGDDSSEVDQQISLEGSLNPKWDKSWQTGSAFENSVKFGVESEKLAGRDIHFKSFYVNADTGEATTGDIVISFDENVWDSPDNNEVLASSRTIATFDSAYVGQTASGEVKLRDLDKFWDANGNFILQDPQTLTLVQGDGTKTDVTIYGGDTLDEVAKKLNNAIANGLGQAKYVDDASHFVEFIGTKSAGNLADTTSDSVPGTFIFRTIVPGEAGKISISSASEELLNAFSLNTIQEATESKYQVSVYDAHTNQEIAKDVKVSGNRLIGVINPNVDVEFDAMNGISASWWDERRKAYVYDTSIETSTTLHLSDNTLVLQVGSNEGDDVMVTIGDMRSNALGIDRVNVMDRENAARAITIIDNAIDKVATQQARLGASQNRLEYHINNITKEAEALTQANSNIRDTDMAKEMMEFTKLQILMQANQAMISQANQMPQNVLSLLR